MTDAKPSYGSSTRRAGTGPLLEDKDEDTEHSLLSCLTHARISRREITHLPAAQDFYNDTSRAVFSVMRSLLEKNGRIDPPLFFKGMRQEGIEVGNDYFRNLRSIGAHPENIGEYSAIIHGLAVRRRVKEAGLILADKAARHTGDPNELLGFMQKAIQDTYRDTSTGRAAGDLVSFHDALDIAWDKIENPETVRFITTGIRALDLAIGGIQEGEIVVVAASSGGGKTSLEMQSVIHAAAHSDKRSLIVTKEMTPDQLALRTLLMRANVDGMEIRRARMDGMALPGETWRRLNEARQGLNKLRGKDGRSHIMIVPPGHTSAQAICSMIRREKSEHGLNLFAIDYLQILDEPIEVSGKSNDSEERRIRLDMQAFKDLAMEERLGGYVLSQFAKRPGASVPKDGSLPRPSMSDLKGSQGVQAAADIILLLHRTTAPSDDDTEIGYPVDCIIAKGRNGGVGVVPLDFDPRYTRFSDRDNPVTDEGDSKW